MATGESLMSAFTVMVTALAMTTITIIMIKIIVEIAVLLLVH